MMDEGVIIESLRHKFKLHVEEGQRKIDEGQRIIDEGKKDLAHADVLKRMIEVYESSVSDNIVSANKNNNSSKEINEEQKKQRPVSERTFEKGILAILEDGQPRTTAMLMREYQEREGRLYSLKDMSAKLAVRASKKDKKIRSIQISELPIGKRFWWVKLEWMDGENLKDEYKKKITGRELVDLFD